MKKLIFVLMPLVVVLAFFSYSLSKDINFNTLLNGLSTIDFKSFDYSDVSNAFNNLDFTNYFSSADNLLDYVIALYDSIIGFFTGIFDLLVFLYKFTYFMFGNLFEFIKYLFSYIFS